MISMRGFEHVLPRPVESIRATGKAFLRAIAEQLTDRRVETARGWVWTVMQVKRVL